MKRFLSWPAIAAMAAVFLAAIVLALWNLFRVSNQIIRAQALGSSRIIAESLDNVRELYTSEVVDRVVARGVVAAHDYERRPDAIPLPATLTIKLGEMIESDFGMQVRLFSDYPFPWRKNGGARDDFERQALKALRLDPAKPFYRFETFQGRQMLRYAQADVMKPACVKCHNAHPQSPKRDWKAGDVRGVLEVTRPIEGIAAETKARLSSTFFLTGLVLVVGLIGMTSVALRLTGVSKELEERVAERTAHLEAANREIESFSYSVSHDLRTPLTSIKGYSHVLAEEYADKLGPQGRDWLARMAAVSSRMGVMLDDLLDFSLASHGKLRLEEVSLSRLASEIAEDMAKTNPRKVDVGIEPGLSARGDPRLLRLVLDNLLGNAWKYTGKTENAVIRFGRARSRGVDAFFVKDNGVGFPSAESARLFTPFQRLHNASEFPGTGIGLGTVKRVVERHGGRVWAEGETGRGATFYFTLPG